jgi:hypothetical protein
MVELCSTKTKIFFMLTIARLRCKKVQTGNVKKPDFRINKLRQKNNRKDRFIELAPFLSFGHRNRVTGLGKFLAIVSLFAKGSFFNY